MNLDVIYHRAQSWVDWSIRSSPKQTRHNLYCLCEQSWVGWSIRSSPKRYSIYLYCLCEERQRRSKLGGQGVVRSSERSPLPGASNSCAPWESSRPSTFVIKLDDEPRPQLRLVRLGPLTSPKIWMSKTQD